MLEKACSFGRGRNELFIGVSDLLLGCGGRNLEDGILLLFR